MEHMSNIFSTSFGINFAKLTLIWLALISLTAKINSLLFLSHPVDIVKSSSAMAERPHEVALFSINVQLHSQNHKIAFLSQPIGNQGQHNKHFV